MGEGCPLEARGPPNLLAPQCIGKGGSSSLRETGVQALGRESTLDEILTQRVWQQSHVLPLWDCWRSPVLGEGFLWNSPQAACRGVGEVVQ